MELHVDAMEQTQFYRGKQVILAYSYLSKCWKTDIYIDGLQGRMSKSLKPYLRISISILITVITAYIWYLNELIFQMDIGGTIETAIGLLFFPILASYTFRSVYIFSFYLPIGISAIGLFSYYILVADADVTIAGFYIIHVLFIQGIIYYLLKKSVNKMINDSQSNKWIVNNTTTLLFLKMLMSRPNSYKWINQEYLQKRTFWV